MSDKTEPGVTFSIPEIMDTVYEKYGYAAELRFDGHGNVFIENMAGEIEEDFNNLNELHLWVAKTNIELDEQETKQSAENDKINAESASVDPMKLRWK